jgi:hypothetical protein
MSVSFIKYDLTRASGTFDDPAQNVVRCCWQEICDCGLDVEGKADKLQTGEHWAYTVKGLRKGDFRVRVEADDGSIAVSSILSSDGGKGVGVRLGVKKAEYAVLVTSYNCTSASGTYSSPTLGIGQCYLQNQHTGQMFPATQIINSNGHWSATFPAVPHGTYRVVAIGFPDGSSTMSSAFNC